MNIPKTYPTIPNLKTTKSNRFNMTTRTAFKKPEKANCLTYPTDFAKFCNNEFTADKNKIPKKYE